ncbi:MAG: dTMP kinase [Candidatus Omnitrophica bacterium]|nr:dTMP kinase [Candidatus Omnitrophota bacterium]
MKKGYFITFEGAEGSGKSTQIRRLAAYLRRNGKKVLLLREPGGTRVSEAIRQVILNKFFKEMKPETELLLYLAARAQIVRQKILPALQKRQVVICDRFEDSTVAYQGYGRKIPLEAIEKVSELLGRGKLVPSLTFILDIDPRKGMARGGRHDRIERESFQFHERVRRGFLQIARKNPKRCIVLNGLESRQAVSQKIRKKIDRVFGL